MPRTARTVSRKRKIEPAKRDLPIVVKQECIEIESPQPCSHTRNAEPKAQPVSTMYLPCKKKWVCELPLHQIQNNVQSEARRCLNEYGIRLQFTPAVMGEICQGILDQFAQDKSLEMNVADFFVEYGDAVSLKNIPELVFKQEILKFFVIIASEIDNMSIRNILSLIVNSTKMESMVRLFPNFPVLPAASPRALANVTDDVFQRLSLMERNGITDRWIATLERAAKDLEDFLVEHKNILEPHMVTMVETQSAFYRKSAKQFGKKHHQKICERDSVFEFYRQKAWKSDAKKDENFEEKIKMKFDSLDDFTIGVMKEMMEPKDKL